MLFRSLDAKVAGCPNFILPVVHFVDFIVAAKDLEPARLGIELPDPRGGRRLLPFDCEVKYKKTTMTVPMKIEDPSDYRPGTKKARLAEKKVWLVEISMPKSLMSDIRTGSVELEDQDIDLADLDDAYEQDLDQDSYQSDQQADNAQQQLQQPAI